MRRKLTGIACGVRAGLYVFDFLGGTDLLPAPTTEPAGIAGHQ